ncbi:hypothetical protein OQE61_00805 [Cetobacterium somerae]|uniref:hypothetical protein n=1 Tax=Cetobacterium somerae TaxID=188913 RepID=UPI00225A5A90|nr:hypothetical protein [Cetobacterium somerae]MCX3066031.1 hypothetical protein [Cetobacterium somerae]
MRKRGLFFLVFFILLSKIMLAIDFNLTRISPQGEYDNGDGVEYQLTLTNNTATGIGGTLSFPLANLTSTLDGGGEGIIFNNLQNSSKTNGKYTYPGSFSFTGNLEATGIFIDAGGSITYTVKGTINPNINGIIDAIANFVSTSGEKITQENTMTRVFYDLEVNKIPTLPYYEKGGTVSYNILVENIGKAPIKSIDIEDILDNSAFVSSSISATSTGIGTNPGIYSPTGNLMAKGAYIAVGGNITYTITGQLNDSFIGTLNNSVSLTSRKKTQTVDANPINLAKYSYTFKKTTLNPDKQYSPNGAVAYRLLITNTSKDIPITNMSLSDYFSQIYSVDANGNQVLAFDTTRITVIPSTGTNSSSAGNISSNTDLNIKNISIAPGDYVSYTVRTFVNPNVVGEIKNTATISDRNGNTLTSEDSGLTSKPANIEISKTSLSNDVYTPGAPIKYLITVKNTGQGIGYNLNVIDNITNIKSSLANSSGVSSQDIEGNPVSTWNIIASLGTESTNSTSNLLQNGGFLNNVNLNDQNVILYPGEEINYTVTIITKDTSIGTISNTAEINGQTSTAIYNPAEVITTGNESITIVKTPNQSEYTPGGTISYNIIVRNLDTKFANNINITDSLSKITALNTNGENSAVVKSWSLNFISKTGNGTTQGEFNYGVENPGTQDLNIVADLGPNGEVIYKLIIKVNPDIVGKIYDDNPSGNVVENGNGISMSPYKLELQKEVNETEYTPGQNVIYTVTISNTGNGTAVNIPVQDMFSDIKTTLVTGVQGQAYTKTVVTGVIYDSKGNIVTSGPDKTGLVNELIDKDLNVKAIISPGNSIVYTIIATINPLADQRIINTALVDGELTSDRGIVTRTTNVNIKKSVNKNSYPNNLDSNGNIISEENETIIYTIEVENSSASGIAMNVPVQDSISTIEAELLSGNQALVFQPGWKIDTQLIGEGTSISGDLVEDGKDINTRVNIAPGGKVVFTITGNINNNGTQIFYGSFTNSATADGITSTATTSPKDPFLRISKSSTNTSYIPGETIEYSIVVENIGSGYANNAQIIDSLNNVVDGAKNKAFSSWTITGTPKGYGTTIGNISDNNDLNTTVDIAPGGSITYNIVAQLNKNLTGIITNEVQVYDPQNGNISTASASEDNANEDGTIFIRKTTNIPSIIPTEDFTYIIDVLNNSKNPIKNIRIVDDLNNIIGNLANENGTSTTDITGPAFTSWKIFKGGVLISTGTNDKLDDLISNLNPQQGVEYKIIAVPNPKLLIQKLKNTANVYNGNDIIASSYIENNVLGSTGGITRSVTPSKYIPGDTLTYIIKISPNSVGYLNNFSVNEDISNLNVKLMNGTQGNVFFNPTTGKNEFNVEFIQNESKVSTGTVPIPLESIKPNTNLVGIVDIAQGDYLVYKITGKIRPDILGDINYKGLVTTFYRQNLSITKQVVGGNYFPGQTLTYLLRVENNSNGNAGQVDLVDNIGNIKVESSKGGIIPAFVPGSIKVANISIGGYGASAPIPADSENINVKIDVPTGGYIQYEISGTVADTAIGRIINELDVDSDTVSAGTSSPQNRFLVTKTMDRYLDVDGLTAVNAGYVPGGYIQYTVTITNQNAGIINNYPLKDLIGDINTTLATGGVGKAFESWTITAEKDTSNATDFGIFQNNQNLDTTVDIGPNGFIKYTILAKVNPLAVGNFSNSVNVNGVIRTSQTAQMAPEVILHTKKVFDSTGTKEITNYAPGDTIVYKIEIQNVGKGTAYGKSYFDTLSSIMANEAGSGSNKVNPFGNKWTINTEKSGDITLIGATLPQNNENISINNMIISQNGSVVFTIKTTVGDKIFGDIFNTSTYGQDSKTAVLKPYPGVISTTNIIKTLNGNTFTGQAYKPGDAITYEITISNTGRGILNDVKITDIFTNILTEESGASSLNQALQNISISPPTVNTGENFVEPIQGDSSILVRKNADILPGQTITIITSATISKKALGIIPENSLMVNGVETKSATINPEQAVLTGSKALIMPSNRIYVPGDNVQYKLTLKNTGLGYGNNVVLKDLIGEITTEIVGGKQGAAFTSWNIIYNGATGSEFSNFTYLNGAINGPAGLNTTIDIGPGVEISFNIEATLSKNIVGNVINTATLGDKVYTSEAITLKPANLSDIEVTKIVSSPTYVPDGNVGFQITIKNNSDTTINNLLISDLISGIKTEQAGGTSNQALKSGWSITTNIIGDTENSAIKIPRFGDLINNEIDLAKETELTINIAGVASSKSLGKIENSAKWSYNGSSSETNKVTIEPEVGSLKISKSANLSNYIPGGTIEYTLNIQNIGSGYVNNGVITDNLLDKTVQLVDGTTAPAFTNIKLINQTSGSNTILGPVDLSNGYLQNSADIYPGDTVKVVISALVNENAYGPITNTATAGLSTGSVTLKSVKGILTANKSVDKLNYSDGDTLTYTINLINSGQGWLKDISVIDELSKIQTEFVNGTTTLAFENSTDLNQTINIAPNSTKTLTISGTLKTGTIGDIVNAANVDGSFTNEVISTPVIKDLNLTITSDEFYKTGNGIDPTEKNIINYTIILKNNEQSAAAADIILTDDILNIFVGSSLNNTIKAFSSYKITEFNYPQEDNITSNIELNKDITDKSIFVSGALKKDGEIIIKLEATLNETEFESPIGNIINLVKVSQGTKTNSAETIVLPSAPKPSITKIIKSIGGKNYNIGMTYSPGDELVYEINITNTGDGYLNNTSLTDNISLLVTELAGDNIGNVLSQYSWSYISNSKRTVIDSGAFMPNTPLNTMITIAPKSNIIITLTGKISDESLGVIPSNQVNLGILNSRTPTISPAFGKLELTKNLTSETTYIPGGLLSYEVRVANTGLGYLNNIKIQDLIGNIQTNSVGGKISSAFSTWSVSGKPDPIDGIVYVDNSYPNTENLDDTLDIAPGVAAVFTVTGVVSNNIYGDITNKAVASKDSEQQTASVTATSKKATVLLTKSFNNSTYSPGGNLGFTITIENNSPAIAAGLNIQDLIESMVVDTIDGSKKFPFKSGYQINTSIIGDSSNTSLNIPTSGNINVTGDLAPNTTVIINVSGFAIDDAVGEISNTATLTYDSKSTTKNATIKPNTGNILITKTSPTTSFTPGKELIYNIKVTNNGDGYASGVLVQDNLSLSGAFDLATIVATPTWDSLSKVNNLNIKNGILTAIADIHPGESINIQIQAQVLKTRIESIANTAEATYLGTTFDNTIVLNSVPGILTINKDQSTGFYEPGNQLYYTLTIENTGDGWLKGVGIYDDLAAIQTQVLGGGIGAAFQTNSIGASIISQGISTLTIDSKEITQGNLVVKGDIAPNTTVTIVIGGNTSENAIGIIQNTARAVQNSITYKSDTVTAIQQIPKLELKKIGDNIEYVVGQPITYTITVVNNTVNNARGVLLKDLISKVTVLNSNGETVPAFKPGWKVSYTSDSLSTVTGVVEDGKDINVVMDIHNFDTVTFTIEAIVIDNAIGAIKNTVSASEFGEPYSSSFESLPKESEITITKTPQIEKYVPGELLTYDITVSNIGLGYGDNIIVQDILSDIVVTTPTGNINAFDISSAIIKIKNISPNVVTTIKNEVRGVDLEDLLDMPPNSSITYEVSAVVAPNAIGPIKNIASAAGVSVENIILSENYKIEATMTQEQTTYIPGKEVQFDLIVENIGLGFAYNIDVKEIITNSLTLGIAGNNLKSFNSWTISKSESQNSVMNRANDLSNTDIDEVVNIPPKGIITYKVTAVVNPELSGDIIVESDVLDSLNKEEFKNSVTFTPPEAILSLSKISNKDNYGDEDEFIIYTLAIENKGIGNIRDIQVTDLISSLKGKNGNSLFTDWQITVKETGVIANEDIPVKDNEDINNILNLRSDAQNKVVYTITGKINKGIDDTITNTFIAKNPLTGKIDTASVTNYIKKIPDNEGELKVIKRALKRDIKIGEAVEYEITVENNNESRFINVVLKDLIPPGFKYIKGTTELVESGADGILNTNDDLTSISEPVLGNGLNFPSITMEPFTKFRVRYLLKPSIGVTFGKYKNQAYMTLNGNKISNTATATVSIIGDSLLDTASIIGKVFFDENGDGYQNDGEKGIPGVRLITPTGVIAITDRFGRYHVPDEWVYSKMGENYEIKLDITTLPENVEILSENPQIKRVTPQGLTKFNFSVRGIKGKNIEDKNRIYLPDGAIWVINDSIEIEPELILNLPERIVVKNGELTEELDFTLKTNYGDFIEKYEIEIYSQEDSTLSSPIGVISGKKIYNDMKVNWNSKKEDRLDFKTGKQLKVRLKVWDRFGNFDATEIGYIDLVSKKPIVDLFDYESKNEIFLQIQNIPLNTGMARFTGDGLKDIEKVYIGEDEYDVDQDAFIASKYMPSDKYNIPVKVVDKNGNESEYSLKVTLPETYYMSTGIADFSIGRNYISGNQEVLNVDNPFGPEYFADNIYNEGRIAYYGRGKYKDKFRFVAHIDTKANSLNEMFNDVLKRDKQTLFQRVEDTDYAYYPTYGDKSYIYRDVETDGKIYLKLQYEKSSIMWGNYNTGFTGSKYMQYNRSLYGAKGNYTSNETTKFGDNKNNITAFASEPDSLYGHDEFLGTGGSLYFLKNGDILSGTEKVWIKIVNSNTSLTEKVIYLQEGKDYEFDPYQGRIILNKPLTGVASNINGDIIQGSSSGNYYSYLIVDYEYIPTNSQNMNEKDYGLRGKTFINDHVGVGGTYIKENKEGKGYTLTGGEVILKATENSYLKGEISRSEGIQSDNSFLSFDGGLNFKKIGSDIENISGNAYNFSGVLNFADLNPEVFSPYGNDIRAWYEKKESGYSFASDLGDKELETYGSEINFRSSDRMKAKIKYESMEKKDYFNSLIDKKETTGIQLEYLITERISAGLAFNHVKELDQNEIGSGDLVGARVEYEIDEDTTVYTEGQITVNKNSNYETNNIITFGGEKSLTEKLTVNGKTSFGTRGNYTEVGTDYNLTDDYTVYLGYSMDGEEDINKITGGQRARLNDKINIYQENQFVKESGRNGVMQSYGADYEIYEDVTFGASFQLGKIELPDNEGESKRKAVSLYSRIEKADFMLKNKIEYREEKEDQKIRQYLTTNTFNYVYSDEYTFAGKINFAFTDDIENYKFIESSIGLAYRPVENDKLNFLSRYTVILNEDPNDSDKSKAYIIEFESIYSLTERWDLGLKTAYRKEQDTYIRVSENSIVINNNLYLIGLKANYTILNDWDIYGQYHWLVDEKESDIASGAIVGIYKNIHRNLKFGGGYNFSGFSDNLGVDDYKAHGWFINAIGRF